MKKNVNFILLRRLILVTVSLSMFSCASLMTPTGGRPSLSTVGLDAGESYRDSIQLIEPTKYVMYVPKIVKVASSGSHFIIEAVAKNKDWEFSTSDEKTKSPPLTTVGWVNPNKSLLTKYSTSGNGDGMKVKITRTYDKPITETKTVDTGIIDFVTKKPVTKQETVLKSSSSKTEVYYGILEFHKIHNESKEDVTARAYYINIPDKYFEDAKNGNIAVLYEYYECKAGSKFAPSKKYTSWVLWLSDIQF